MNDLIVTENDEVFICGWYDDSLNFSPLPNENIHYCQNGSSSYISKYDTDLNYIASIAFEGEITISDLFRTTENSTFLYTGYFVDTVTTSFTNMAHEVQSIGFREVIYGEFDDDLNFIKQKTIASEGDELGFHIGQLANGTTVLQFNFAESIEFQYGTDTILVEGIYPFLGSSGSAADQNTMLVCLGENEIVWYKRFSALGAAKVFPQTEFIQDENGNLIACYYYTGLCNLGEENFTTVYNDSQLGTFILRIDQTGTIRWVRRLTIFGPGRAIVYAMVMKDDNLYGGGQFSGNLDFDLSVNTNTQNGYQNPFLTKWTLNDQFLAMDEDSETYSNLFPNPSNQHLFLKETNISELRILDMIGRAVDFEANFNGTEYQINTSLLSDGTYVLSYRKDNSGFLERFVVQH